MLAAMESGEEPRPAQAGVKAFLLRNPFASAFIAGIVILTILPFLQERTLRAPPALAPAPSLSALSTLDGTAPPELAGRVLFVSVHRGPCPAECVEALRFFGQAVEHVQDTPGKVALVSVVEAAGAEQAKGSLGIRPAGWHVLTASDATTAPIFSAFAAAFDKQAESLGRKQRDLFATPSIAVVDQSGSIRGFWPADDAGRGHAITAVRMFARHGASP